MSPKIIFIVPYRNRENDKIHFEVYIKYLLEDIDSNDYEIYYSHQNDTRAFNRGAVKNIGFIAMRDKYPDTYKSITFVFNDIDTLPIRKNMLDYITTHGTVKHYYGFNYALGGIFSITGQDFEKINGFPNFWGWGFEDNVINDICIENNINIDRSNFYNIYDNNFLQTSITTKKILNNRRPDINNCSNDNLSTIKDLNYTIDKNIININNFDTIVSYTNMKFYTEDLAYTKGKIDSNKEKSMERLARKARLAMRF